MWWPDGSTEQTIGRKIREFASRWGALHGVALQPFSLMPLPENSGVFNSVLRPPESLDLWLMTSREMYEVLILAAEVEEALDLAPGQKLPAAEAPSVAEKSIRIDRAEAKRMAVFLSPPAAHPGCRPVGD